MNTDHRELLTSFNLTHIDKSEITAALSPVLKELVELLGLDATLAIVNKFGGTRLFFSKSVVKKSKLISVIGQEKYEHLVKYYRGRGTDVYIPNARKLRQFLRDKAIIEMRRKHMPIAEIALKMSLSERRVAEICARHRSSSTASQPERADP